MNRKYLVFRLKESGGENFWLSAFPLDHDLIVVEAHHIQIMNAAHSSFRSVLSFTYSFQGLEIYCTLVVCIWR